MIRNGLIAAAGLLAAASPSLAADAPVTMVEPEPAEYVRICDIYGKGFFYIPGTETCASFSGYVRIRFGGNTGERNQDFDGPDDSVGGTALRARLDFDAREETELGTLRAKIRLEANQIQREVGEFQMAEGFIQLGGLTVGTLDSLWTNDDGGIDDGLLMEEADWAAADFQSNRISYAAGAGAFTGIVSLEDDGTGDFVPDVLAKATYVTDTVKAYIMGVYDEDQFDDLNGYGDFLNAFVGRSPNGDFDGSILFQPDDYDGGGDAFVVKGAIRLDDLLLDGSTFKVEGHYAFDPSIYAVVNDLRGSFGFGEQRLDPSIIPTRYQIGGAYSQEVGKFTFIASGVYGETEGLDVSYSNLPGLIFADVGSESYFGVGGNIVYDVTESFTITGEVSYRDIDLPAGIDDFDRTTGFLQFRQNF